MHRFHTITMLAPLFSVLPLSAWLILVGSTLLGMAMNTPATSSLKRIR